MKKPCRTAHTPMRTRASQVDHEGETAPEIPDNGLVTLPEHPCALETKASHLREGRVAEAALPPRRGSYIQLFTAKAVRYLLVASSPSSQRRQRALMYARSHNGQTIHNHRFIAIFRSYSTACACRFTRRCRMREGRVDVNVVARAERRAR